MRIGVTILKDSKGEVFVYSGQGEVVLPLAPLAEQKDLVKAAAVTGLKIGGKVFDSALVVSQFGIETRKSFPAVTGKKSKKEQAEAEAEADEDAKAKAEAEAEANETK